MLRSDGELMVYVFNWYLRWMDGWMGLLRVDSKIFEDFLWSSGFYDFLVGLLCGFV